MATKSQLKSITDKSGENASKLKSHNVYFNRKRTSVRLEDEMWEALKIVASHKNVSIHDVCDEVHSSQSSDASFTSALRVYLLSYFRELAQDRLPPYVDSRQGEVI